MYQVMNGRSFSETNPLFLKDVFLFGPEGIPLQGKCVVNRFANFADDQLLIWLLHHENRELEGLDGVVMPLYGDWSCNFWHWCNETLPMALAAHQGGFNGRYLVPPVPFAAESLRLIGVRPDRIVVAKECDYHLECMCLVPKLLGSNTEGMPQRMKLRELFRSLFAQDAPRHRLYLSRNGHPDNLRKVLHEEALLAMLGEYGFNMLRLEEMPLSEQLAYSCNAEAIVAPHGAGLTHCGFMPENSLVIEFFAPTYVNPCMLLHCDYLKHRYYQVTSPCLYAGYQHDMDIEVHGQILGMTLERELARREQGAPGPPVD